MDGDGYSGIAAAGAIDRAAAFLRRGARLEDVERTSRRVAELLDDMRIDHRRFHMRVTEVLLDLANVDAVEQQVRGEAVSPMSPAR